MKIRFAWLALAVFPVFIPSCVAGKRDMERVLKVMQQENPADYERVFKSFVRHASQGDADAMVALTSEVTVARMGGRAKLKEHYKQNMIPAFKAFPIMSPGGESHYLPPEKDSVGWTFVRTFKSRHGEERRFEIFVLKEQGQIRVAGAR
ncbi:hypothetical protein [Prosthecobacter sp. SYSU 5D2]|uniref:hypothetical protein n=1 Tax=Prosthecobacter sp. SYSU 5D2 TaxID=3134134 RepID=UPI0031FE52B5